MCHLQKAVNHTKLQATHTEEKTMTQRFQLTQGTLGQERAALIRLLQVCNGSPRRVARRLGISHMTVYRRLAEHDIDAGQFRGK